MDINFSEYNSIINQISNNKLFRRYVAPVWERQNNIACSFVLKQTNFIIIFYQKYHFGVYYFCFEKMGLIWNSYTFFEMLDELPLILQEKLLFDLDIFSKAGETRYEFKL